MVVSAGVVNEPVEPVPPPLGEEHEVLLVDVHDMVVFELYVIDDGVAIRVTEGLDIPLPGDKTLVTVVTLPPPPHEANPTVKRTTQNMFTRTLDPTANILDMFVFLAISA